MIAVCLWLTQLICHYLIGILNEFKARKRTQLVAPSLQVVFSEFPTCYERSVSSDESNPNGTMFLQSQRGDSSSGLGSTWWMKMTRRRMTWWSRWECWRPRARCCWTGWSTRWSPWPRPPGTITRPPATAPRPLATVAAQGTAYSLVRKLTLN